MVKGAGEAQKVNSSDTKNDKGKYKPRFQRTQSGSGRTSGGRPDSGLERARALKELAHLLGSSPNGEEAGFHRAEDGERDTCLDEPRAVEQDMLGGTDGPRMGS